MILKDFLMKTLLLFGRIDLENKNNHQKRFVFKFILPENYENEWALLPMFSSFFKEFKLNQLLRKCNISKEKGIPTKEVFQMIFLLPFTGKSFSGFLHSRSSIFPGKKDTIKRPVVTGENYFSSWVAKWLLKPDFPLPVVLSAIPG